MLNCEPEGGDQPPSQVAAQLCLAPFREGRGEQREDEAQDRFAGFVGFVLVPTGGLDQYGQAATGHLDGEGSGEAPCRIAVDGNATPQLAQQGIARDAGENAEHRFDGHVRRPSQPPEIEGHLPCEGPACAQQGGLDELRPIPEVAIDGRSADPGLLGYGCDSCGLQAVAGDAAGGRFQQSLSGGLALRRVAGPGRGLDRGCHIEK